LLNSFRPVTVSVYDQTALRATILVLIDQLSRLFEMKVAPLSLHFQMFLLKQTNHLISPFASFDSA
jgi:hypothetical protein